MHDEYRCGDGVGDTRALQTTATPLAHTHVPTRSLARLQDGFPIYGPQGPGGTRMQHAAQGCTGDYCLDACSGLEMARR